MRKIAILIALFLLTGCTELNLISGGSLLQNGNYLVNGGNPIQIEIKRIGVGTQLGRMEVIVKNTSAEAIEFDCTQTIISTDRGEQIQAVSPDNAAEAISSDAFSQAMLGTSKSIHAAESSRGEIRREGIGKVLIQPNGFIEGALFFIPPKQDYSRLIFTFKDIQGAPQVITSKTN